MNFGEVIKKEILSKPCKDLCCKKAFLAGLIRGTGELYYRENQLGLDFSVNSEETASLVANYLKRLFDFEVREVAVDQDRLNRKDKFIITIFGEKTTQILTELGVLLEDSEEVAVNLKFYGELTKKECCLKSFIKGLFIAIGGCTVPSKENSGTTGYHLEMIFSHSAPAMDTAQVLLQHGVSSKIMRRKESYVLYIKSVDEIKNFIAFLSASVSVLRLTDLSIERELSNNSNRQKNCDLGNAGRQVDATARQIEAINLLKEKGLLEGLKKDLYDTALARVEYADDTLLELAERLEITKSCLNHRLRKLLAMSREL